MLGQALFRDRIREAFLQARTQSEDRLSVQLFVEADDDLRTLWWERLCAVDEQPRFLLFDQRTPLTLALSSAADRRFPPGPGWQTKKKDGTLLCSEFHIVIFSFQNNQDGDAEGSGGGIIYEAATAFGVRTQSRVSLGGGGAKTSLVVESGMHKAFRHRFLLKEGGEIVADIDFHVLRHHGLLSEVQIPCYVSSTPESLVERAVPTRRGCLWIHGSVPSDSIIA